MDMDRRKKEALFRYSVLGAVLSRQLKRGELKHTLQDLALKTWTDELGRLRRMRPKTLEEWYYRFRRTGFEGLMPRTRSDFGQTKALSEEIRELVLAMKREDPGRSAALILKELQNAQLVELKSVSVSTIRRLLRREHLSCPRMEIDRPGRLRWQASTCGDLWQTDACHGPKLLCLASGKPVRVKIFALLDDRSRLVPHLRAFFHETQACFLHVLLGAIQRRGIPRAVLADNHKSFTGVRTRIACAKLNLRMTYARPYDGPSKGKIERFWRRLRAEVLDRLDLDKIETIQDLNLRLWAWVEAEYNNRPHAGLSGRTPLQVWEEDADQIRWVEDFDVLDEAFTHSFKRYVRNDSTCQIDGRCYEVPTHLRRQKVEIHQSLLVPENYWIEDASGQVLIREVDAEANASRSRIVKRTSDPKPQSTGMNAVEDLLRRVTRPLKREGEDGNAAA